MTFGGAMINRQAKVSWLSGEHEPHRLRALLIVTPRGDNPINLLK